MGAFFNKFRKKKIVETTSKVYEDETIHIELPDNKYRATKLSDRDYYFVWNTLDYYANGSLTTIKELEDGNFVMQVNEKNIKLPSVERGLQYLKELDIEKERLRNAIDIDLTK